MFLEKFISSSEVEYMDLGYSDPYKHNFHLCVLTLVWPNPQMECYSCSPFCSNGDVWLCLMEMCIAVWISTPPPLRALSIGLFWITLSALLPGCGWRWMDRGRHWFSKEKPSKTDYLHLSVTPGLCPYLHGKWIRMLFPVYFFAFCLETFPD